MSTDSTEHTPPDPAVTAAAHGPSGGVESHDEHGDGHDPHGDGHDGHDEHGGEPLGPIDTLAWGAGILGVALGLVVVFVFMLSTASAVPVG